MAGTLHYSGDIPETGTNVLILVNGANRPTGLWSGKLVSTRGALGISESGAGPGRESWISACATINDPDCPEEYRSREPHANYEILPAPIEAQGAILELMRRLAAAQEEIRGLQRRRQIELDLVTIILRGMVDKGAADRMEQLAERILRAATP